MAGYHCHAPLGLPSIYFSLFTFLCSLFTVPKPLLHPLHRDVGYDVCQVETQLAYNRLDELDAIRADAVRVNLVRSLLHAKVRLSERKSKYICVFPGASTFDEAKGAGFC